MVKNPFSRITEDRGSWYSRKLSKARIYCLKSYSGFLVKIIAFSKGISIKRGCIFFGVPHFHRYPFSKIEIGNNCTFRSDKTSNLIGVNHKYILSTRQKGSVIIIGNDCGFSGVSIGPILEIRIGNNVL